MLLEDPGHRLLIKRLSVYPLAVLLISFVCHLDWAAPDLDLQASRVVSKAFENEGLVDGLTILMNLLALDA